MAVSLLVLAAIVNLAAWIYTIRHVLQLRRENAFLRETAKRFKRIENRSSNSIVTRKSFVRSDGKHSRVVSAHMSQQRRIWAKQK